MRLQAWSRMRMGIRHPRARSPCRPIVAYSRRRAVPSQLAATANATTSPVAAQTIRSSPQPRGMKTSRSGATSPVTASPRMPQATTMSVRFMYPPRSAFRLPSAARRHPRLRSSKRNARAGDECPPVRLDHQRPAGRTRDLKHRPRVDLHDAIRVIGPRGHHTLLPHSVAIGPHPDTPLARQRMSRDVTSDSTRCTDVAR